MSTVDRSAAADALPTPSRTRLWWEIAIVLTLSVGRSAVYSVLSLLQALTREQALGDQSTSLNPGANAQQFWDVLYQFVAQFFALAPIALAIYLLWGPGASAFRRIGLDFRSIRLFGRDLGAGVLLIAVIGAPGLGLYVAGRALGITVQVDASPLDPSWWTVPLLLLAALRAGLTEEVIFIGYLFDRLRRLGWGTWAIILSTAALRGAYHAYQGWGPLAGNIAMGIVFGWVYQRWGRVMSLVIAHTFIDVIAFVGYPLAAAWWPALFV
ncbi:CPBP family intramembrane glutamic endopeptidase [Microbacterium sp.]|uniref:CPBP family intramembrane glutamic endopeptidase n=1 Tax=Microbacterium sp. TaxID=51671 RepID=UPI003C734A1C